jgi:Tfp pilus assembly protein PilV
LLEVILAIAVLFASTVALAQLASLGRRHADRAENMTTAQTLCQNKMNEIIAGLSPLVSTADTPFLEAPGWAYTIDVQPATWNSLIAVKVSVAKLPMTDAGRVQSVDTIEASAPTTVDAKPRFSLVRWLRTTTASAAEASEPFGRLSDERFGDQTFTGANP